MCTPADIYSWLLPRHDPQQEPTSKMADNFGEGSVSVIPIVQENPYQHRLPVLGHGGFSDVYAVCKKRKQRKSSLLVRKLRREKTEVVDPYPFAAKVCELNPANTELKPEEKKKLNYIQIDQYNANKMQVSRIEVVEAEVKMLQHVKEGNNVVKLVDVFLYKPKDQVWLIMEKLVVDIGTLAKKEYFEQGEAAEDARKCILREVLLGLQFLKSRQLVHGDIKPENIMLSLKGQVKICDFGVAQRIQDEKPLTVTCTRGSPQFMAPELFIEGHEYDYAVDMWAFGMVAYALYNKNKAAIVKFNDRVWKGLWDMWKEGEGPYYSELLQGFYSSREERQKHDSVIFKGRLWKLEEESFKQKFGPLEKSLDTWFSNHGELVKLVRSCLVPIPSKGPNGEVIRNIHISRVSIEEALKMGYCAELQDVCIVGLIKNYIEVSNKK